MGKAVKPRRNRHDKAQDHDLGRAKRRKNAVKEVAQPQRHIGQKRGGQHRLGRRAKRQKQAAQKANKGADPEGQGHLQRIVCHDGGLFGGHALGHQAFGRGLQGEGELHRAKEVPTDAEKAEKRGRAEEAGLGQAGHGLSWVGRLEWRLTG